jgi:hypothetical protein
MEDNDDKMDTNSELAGSASLLLGINISAATLC